MTFLSLFLVIVLSNISLLVLAVIGLSAWLFIFSGPECVGTGEDQVLQSITCPEYHIYKWGGSREPGLLNVYIFWEPSL